MTCVHRGFLGGVAVVILRRFPRVAFAAGHRDIVVARLGCLKVTGLRLRRRRPPVGLLFAEALVERVTTVFIDIVQPSCERCVVERGIVLVAGHLCGIRLTTPQRCVRVGGGVVPGQVFGMISHTLMMEERPAAEEATR